MTGLLAVALLLGSCSTPKDIAYFPELQTGSIVQANKILDIRVKPEDKLSIAVTTQDPALSSLFNLTQSSSGSQSGDTGGTIGNGSSSGSSACYTVDSYGDIDFPVLGKIHIAGLTREEVAAKITEDLVKADLVKDPIVIVEFNNTGIAILGEVNKPGRYNFNRDHLTILDAIAMAGDLKIDGMREDILVLRNIGNGKQESYRVNLLNAQELASSPVYYLQQDDVIYVVPNDKAKRQSTPNGNSPFTPSFWLTLGSFAITITTLVITLTR